MARTTSAKKATRSAARKHVFNTRRKRALKDATKGVAKFVASKQGKEATAALPGVYQAIDKATKRGVIKAGTAARMKSRLVKRIKALG